MLQKIIRRSIQGLYTMQQSNRTDMDLCIICLWCYKIICQPAVMPAHLPCQTIPKLRSIMILPAERIFSAHYKWRVSTRRIKRRLTLICTIHLIILMQRMVCTKIFLWVVYNILNAERTNLLWRLIWRARRYSTLARSLALGEMCWKLIAFSCPVKTGLVIPVIPSIIS